MRSDEININLSERNNIIKLQSLVHPQMSSAAFKPMIQYAWYKSEYLTNNPGPFKNVKQVCFNFEIGKCCEKDCINCQMIRCSWCHKELCFVHFFIDYHYH